MTHLPAFMNPDAISVAFQPVFDARQDVFFMRAMAVHTDEEGALTIFKMSDLRDKPELSQRLHEVYLQALLAKLPTLDKHTPCALTLDHVNMPEELQQLMADRLSELDGRMMLELEGDVSVGYPVQTTSTIKRFQHTGVPVVMNLTADQQMEAFAPLELDGLTQGDQLVDWREKVQKEDDTAVA